MISEILLICSSTLILLTLIGKWTSSKNLPPGPIRLPLIGNLLQLALNKKNAPYEIFQDMCRTYGPIMYIQLGLTYQVVLEDYQHIKEVLTSDVWVERYYNSFFAQRSFGKILGVLMVSGDGWKEMRRFTIRTLRDFGFGKQKSMEMTLQEELQDLTESLLKKIEKDNIVPMKQFFTISVLNILWSMMAGFRFSPNDAKLQNLLVLIDKELKTHAIGDVGGPMYLYSAFPFLEKFLEGYFSKENAERRILTDKLHQFFRDILEERRAIGDYKYEQRDYIDVFLREIEASKNAHTQTNHYTDEQFIVVSMDLFMAGSETTSNTIEYAILFMILHPEIQAKVQAEIDAVVGTSRLPSIADKPNLPYTEATLLEVQRRANILPMIVRSPAHATTVGNYFIPKDTIGMINFYAMHMNEKTWTNPFEFNPERFLDSQNNVINADKILPFGIGKRMCLGEVLAKASMFTFFTTMLQRFSFSRPPHQGIPTTEPDIGFTLSPEPYDALIKERVILKNWI